jgi:hypothetical protein
MDVSIRDQTSLAVFYGVFLGTDLSAGPKPGTGWEPGALAPASVLERLRSDSAQGEHWGVYRLAWRSSLGVSSIALIHRASVWGQWTFDEANATPQNAGLFDLTQRTFAPPPLSAAVEDDRRALSEYYGQALLAPPRWHALALVHRKHV